MRRGALYPAFLDLRGAGVLVVGGGAVALRKLRGLPPGAGPIRVVAPRFSAALESWARRRGGVDLVRRPFRATDLKGCRLVFCCADAPGPNAAAAREGRTRGVWVCQAQEPSQGDLQVPAVARAGGLALALSTGGASPAVARGLRLRLEALLRGSDLPWLLGRLRRLRPRLKADPALKARVLARATTPAALALALAPRAGSRRRRLESLLEP